MQKLECHKNVEISDMQKLECHKNVEISSMQKLECHKNVEISPEHPKEDGGAQEPHLKDENICEGETEVEFYHNDLKHTTTSWN